MEPSSTIVASATGRQSSAVGICRISGPRAFDVMGHLLHGPKPIPRQFSLCNLVDPQDGQLIDRVGVLRFDGPASYTGENVLEIHHHGSLAIGHLLINRLIEMPGFRIADAGEFTRRALRHGKMNQFAAEAIGDLIAARSTSQLKSVASQLLGHGHSQLLVWGDTIKSILAGVEAEIDFGTEDDIDDEQLNRHITSIQQLMTDMQRMLEQSRLAIEATGGYLVVIFGAPNVGKSSLLNAMVRREAAIVTAEAGTTRDPIEVTLELGGHLITLVDTAGLRDAVSTVERIGIERSLARLERADMQILVSDDVAGLNGDNQYQGLKVLSKCDQRDRSDTDPVDAIMTSAVTGDGITELLTTIERHIPNQKEYTCEGTHLNARQSQVLSEVLDALSVVQQRADLTIDLVAEELRRALRAVARLTGAVESEDLLDEIFAKFCVGK